MFFRLVEGVRQKKNHLSYSKNAHDAFDLANRCRMQDARYI